MRFCSTTVDSVPSARPEEAQLTTMFVASAGGHLEQLHLLKERLNEPSVRFWITYATEQSRMLLVGEQVITAHHPTTKNLPNALRNYKSARRVFAEHKIERVISTGAAVAVPFMLRARQLGIPCH